MALASLRSRAPAGDQRGRWTAVAAAVFAAGGFLAALVGTTILAALGVAGGGLESIGPVGLEEVGAVVLWFAAPTIGVVVTATPTWALLVEVLGDRLASSDDSGLIFPILGGLTGFTSGIAAHVVMWLIIMVVVTVYEGPLGPGLLGELVRAIYLGLLLGVFSIGFTGIVSGPIVAVTGVVLGLARDRFPPEDDRPGSDDGGWERMSGGPA